MAISETTDTELEADPPSESASAKPKMSGLKAIMIAAGAAFFLCSLGGAYAIGLVGRVSASMGWQTIEPGAVDLPEIVANLNAGPHRTAFVKLKAQLELANKADEPAVIAAQPKMKDLFLTYLRDMRPDELRGSGGTYRLREELVTRANIALAPARVTEILFVELLVQ